MFRINACIKSTSGFMESKKITVKNRVEDIVLKYPGTVNVFFKHGIPAIACGEPLWGTIEENAKRYRVKDIESLLEELNKKAEKTFIIE